MRARRAWLMVGVVAAVLLSAAQVAGADETTYGGNSSRTGSIDDAGLTALTVGNIAQQWSTGVDGTTSSTPNQMYAQPLSLTGLSPTYPDGLAVVATEDNEVEAVDPTDGTREWSLNLGPGWTPNQTCGDLLPHIGITSTPTYDSTTHTLYVVAKVAGATPDTPTISVHAIDVLTGKDRTTGGWPLIIHGSSTNGGQPFNPATNAQRPGLLLVDGALYIGFASHCDNGPFNGFVARVGDLGATPSLSLCTPEESPANGWAGIWQGGTGIATGNGSGAGPAPADGTPGSTPPGDLSESLIRLAVDPTTGAMHAADFFSPTTNKRLDTNDADFGSGGPIALPDSYGSGTHPHLLATIGKDGILRLLDRDNLGGVGQGPHGTDAVVDSVAMSSGVWGHPAAFDGGAGRRFIYVIPANGSLTALRVAPDAGGNPTLSTLASTTTTFPFGSGPPVVTSDDGDPTTALVWVVRVSGPTGTGAQLLAYPAVPPSGGTAWQPLATFPLPTMAKFVQPAADGGRILVGTRTGQVLSFGVASSAPIAATAPPTDFGSVAVGSSSTQTVTVTANTALTGLTVTSSGPFSAGAPSTTSVAAGGTFTVPVTFTPTGSGLAAGRLVISAKEASAQTSLRGTGLEPGFTATPGTLAIGAVALGQSAGNGVQIVNTGSTSVTFDKPATLTDVTGPAGLTLAGTPPKVGTVIAPGAAITVRVTYSPTKGVKSGAQSPATATLSLDATVNGNATHLNVPVTATAYSGEGQLYLTTTSIDFGNVAPGYRSNPESFQAQNVGDATMTITKAAPPAAPFVTSIPIKEGSTVQPGGQATALYAQLLAAPISAMPQTEQYAISVDGSADGVPKKYVTVTVNTHPWTAPISGPYGCPSVSGTARSGAAVVLGSCSGSAARFTRSSGGYFHAGSASSTLCLQAHGAGTTSGTAVEVGTCKTSKAAHGQTWVIGSQGTLYDAKSRLCLRPKAGATKPGTRIVVEKCSATAKTEKWDLSNLLPQRGALSSGLKAVGVLCLTDRAGSHATGTPMQLAGCAFGASQSVAHIGSTLRVMGGCIARSGNSVVLQPCSGASSQAWTADSHGRLVNAASKTCITVPGNRTTSGTTLTLATCSGTTGQRWTLPDSPQAR